MKTTKAQFRVFQEHAELWLDRFGLGDWEVAFEHSTADPDEFMAWCKTELESKCAVIGLNIEQNGKLTTDEIKDCARHEAMELLLAGLDTLARRKDANDKEIDRERHAIIHHIEHAWRDKNAKQ